MGVVSLLPTEDTAPIVMFHDFICEEQFRKYFDVKISCLIFCTLLPDFLELYIGDILMLEVLVLKSAVVHTAFCVAYLLSIKADSHITCCANAIPPPCRAAKGLECVYPI